MTSQGKVRSNTMTGVRVQRRQYASLATEWGQDRVRIVERACQRGIDASIRKLLCLQRTPSPTRRYGPEAVVPAKGSRRTSTAVHVVFAAATATHMRLR